MMRLVRRDVSHMTEHDVLDVCRKKWISIKDLKKSFRPHSSSCALS
jgi:hypothetical protein